MKFSLTVIFTIITLFGFGQYHEIVNANTTRGYVTFYNLNSQNDQPNWLIYVSSSTCSGANGNSSLDTLEITFDHASGLFFERNHQDDQIISSSFTDNEKLTIIYNADGEYHGEYFIRNYNYETIATINIGADSRSIDSISIDPNSARIQGDTLKFCNVHDYSRINLLYHYSNDHGSYTVSDECVDNVQGTGLYVNDTIKFSRSSSHASYNIKTGDSIYLYISPYYSTQHCNDCELNLSGSEAIKTKKYFVYVEENPMDYRIATSDFDSLVCPGEIKAIKRADNASDPVKWEWIRMSDGRRLYTNKDSVISYYTDTFFIKEILENNEWRCPVISNKFSTIKDPECNEGLVNLWVRTKARENVKDAQVFTNLGFTGYTNENGNIEIYFDEREGIVDSVFIKKKGYADYAFETRYEFDEYYHYRVSARINGYIQNDLDIDLRSGRNRPGFTIPYVVTVKNHGQDRIGAGVQVEFPSNLTYVTHESSTQPDSVGTGVLKWNKRVVWGGGKREYKFYFKLSSQTELGSSLPIKTYIIQDDMDDITQNDTLLYNPLVTGAYDPNDKSATYIGPHQDFDIHDTTLIQYRINFQNTGTDTAFTVVVKDKISEFLDISTINMLGANHNYSMSLNEDSIIWTFNDILLPDSNTNEKASHGFIDFEISQIANNPHMTEISNTGYIYFDYNSAIITNTHVSRIFHDVVSGIQPISAALKLFPNPASSTLNLKSEIPGEISVIDISGKVLMKKEIISDQTIDISNLSNGLYHIQFESSKGGRSILSFVKK